MLFLQSYFPRGTKFFCQQCHSNKWFSCLASVLNPHVFCWHATPACLFTGQKELRTPEGAICSTSSSRHLIPKHRRLSTYKRPEEAPSDSTQICTSEKHFLSSSPPPQHKKRNSCQRPPILYLHGGQDDVSIGLRRESNIVNLSSSVLCVKTFSLFVFVLFIGRHGLQSYDCWCLDTAGLKQTRNTIFFFFFFFLR